MNINPASPWFPAAAWIAFVVVGSLVVEVFCIATGKMKISTVVWWLTANYTVPVAMVVCTLLAHFFWQKSTVYQEFRRKNEGDEPKV